MWIAMGIGLPTLTICAWLLAPPFPAQSFSDHTISFPELLQSQVSDNYIFNIKKNYTGDAILEIVHLSDFNAASELVTIGFNNALKGNATEQLLGIMGNRKSVIYSLEGIAPPFTITIKDTLNNKVLSNVKF